MATDPVCGMKVNEQSATQTTHAGKTYYFCSEDCKKTFCANPNRFTGAAASSRA